MKLKKFENFEEDWDELEEIGGNASMVLIDRYDTNDLDFILYHELEQKFGFNYEKDRVNGNYGVHDGYPINIDFLINKLQEFKNNNANYVGIEYNVDHMSYTLSALKIDKE